MAEEIRDNGNGKARIAVTPELVLLANGSSGRWDVTVDESAHGAEEWLLQIDGPSLHLTCDIDDPGVLHHLASYLKSTSEAPTVLCVGQSHNVRFQWDSEHERVLVIAVGPASRPVIRCSLQDQDVRDLEDAVCQAAQDLS